MSVKYSRPQCQLIFDGHGQLPVTLYKNNFKFILSFFRSDLSLGDYSSSQHLEEKLSPFVNAAN